MQNESSCTDPSPQKPTRTRSFPCMLGFLLLLCGFVPAPHAQEWDANPKVFGVNVLSPHATSMPYSTLEEAKAGKRRASDQYQSLAGTWKFYWVDKPASRHATFFQDNFDVSAWKDIAVPGSWQVQGYDRPIYTNVTYPWAGSDNISPPAAPKNYNPVGHYRREFTVPAGWTGKRIRLHFEGVESAYYVWVNGQSVGYSENSFTDHEFDITDKLRSGKNNISVQVFRWCDGSWMEDQDFIRLSGIHRDVYLYATPKTHIQDFQINADLASNYKDGDLNASIWVKNTTAAASSGQSVDLTLYDDKGAAVGTALNQLVGALAAGGENKVSFRSAVTAPALWSGEKPNLYTAVLALKDAAGTVVQYESARIGFRKVELKKDAAGMTRYYINNSPIKFRGVNRHEIDPDLGHVMTDARMEQDVLLMKRLNINALRMSHYPNDPRMYDLCDKYGIYVIDEANLETHGVRDNVPKSSDDWRGASVERMSSMIQRDKNHPCVVLWSLGNEAGGGNVFTSMRDYAHTADATRPVHYEGDWANTDVNSWMYYGYGAVQSYSDNSKPIMLCEYEHAMGSSEGDLQEYLDAFYSNPRSFGGFIWDFIDQGLRRGKTGFFNYGGLWGDNPNDDNFCANGLVNADRIPDPEAWEVKHQYASIQVKGVDLAKGVVAIENRFNFSNVSEYEAVWELKEDGKAIQTGTLPAGTLDITPLTTRNVTVPFTVPTLHPGSAYHLDLDFHLKADASWGKAGHSVAHAQFELPFTVPRTPKIDLTGLPKLTTTQANGLVNLSGPGFAAVFDTKKGTLTSYTLGTLPLIKEGPVPNFWRAPTDNDRGNGMASRTGKWQNAGRDRVVAKSTVTTVSATETRIDLSLNLPNAGSSSMTMAWTFYGSGDVVVDYTLVPDATMSEIPNVGTFLTMPEGFETLRWFGRGPHENYVGRNRSSYVGQYSLPVDSTITLYPELNETGQRTDVHWAALTNAAGLGLLAVGSPLMEINAQHHTPAQLTATKYPWDLTRQGDITFRIDLRQMGLGGIDSWGSKPQDAQMNFAKNTYKHSFRLSPIKAANIDLDYLARMGFKNLATSDSIAQYQTPTVGTVAHPSIRRRIEVLGVGRFDLEQADQATSVEILDLTGRTISRSPVANDRASVGRMAPGLYIVRFTGLGWSRSLVAAVTGNLVGGR
jgi:beta-galactosidase